MKALWHELPRMPALEIAERIRRGDFSPSEVVRAHLERIDEVNPRINAVVVSLREEALALAQAADERVVRWRAQVSGREELPAFLGVPFTVKDTFAFEGKPWVVGSKLRRGIVADRTAPLVRRCLEAGAIPLGLTNTPEALTWIETDNPVYGLTQNPWDLRRTPGGSSGGEAAIIAAGGSAFGLGSDMGGSIRTPANFCGIAGHKPTAGWVPTVDGSWPVPQGAAADYACGGPLARAVGDLFPLLQILSGGRARLSPESVDLSRVRVLHFTDNGEYTCGAQVRACMEDTVRELGAEGRFASVEAWSAPEFQHSSRIWFGMMAQAGGPSFSEIITESMPEPGRLNLLSEWLRLPFGAAHHTMPVLSLATLERAMSRGKGSAARWAEAGVSLRSKLAQALGDDGVLICPVYTSTAPRHHVAKLDMFHWAYAGIFNVMGLPATAVPRGLSSAGLPVGVQVVAGAGRDHLALAVARVLERRTVLPS